MADIFISYQRQERDAVAIVAEKLRALKFDVWFDEALRAGGSYDEEIASNLKTAKAVLVCWTPAAIASEWVRAEAAMAHNDGRLLAAFLEPTELIPPFNLVHAENLMTWAGQEDDEGWLGLLARFGEMTGRPGVTTYYRAMRPEATAAELRAWAQANGADPLAEKVWERIALIEGESGAARIAREKAEARTRDLKRAENAARSKALAKARGLRDPKEQARRMVRITAGLVVVALLAAAGVGYTIYGTARLRELDNIADTEGVRAFLVKNSWGPIHDEGVKKFYEIDAADWAETRARGTIIAYDLYVASNTYAPKGKFLAEAKRARDSAKRIAEAQSLLTRLRLYDGEANGNLDEKTYEAITTFQFRRGEIVDGAVNEALIGALNQNVTDRIATPPAMIRPGRTGEPTEDDYRRLAARLQLDAPTLMTVRWVEGSDVGFTPEGQIKIFFNPQVFSRLTNHQYDESYPLVSPQKGENLSGSPQNFRWEQLNQAYKLDPRAAYEATSYGSYQILGADYKIAGFETPSEFALFMAESEASQLEAFVRLIRAKNLLDELQRHDWAGFARGYNGSEYKLNHYDEILERGYVRLRNRFLNAP